MKQSELHTFIASTPLVLSFIPFIFAPFPIFASVALITTGADAVACIIGKKYGKHSLKTNSKKTVEGFIAGGLSTTGGPGKPAQDDGFVADKAKERKAGCLNFLRLNI